MAAKEVRFGDDARVKMFRFDDRDVATMTTTKPIEFFPA